jgi:hypothetical protein
MSKSKPSNFDPNEFRFSKISRNLLSQAELSEKAIGELEESIQRDLYFYYRDPQKEAKSRSMKRSLESLRGSVVKLSSQLHKFNAPSKHDSRDYDSFFRQLSTKQLLKELGAFEQRVDRELNPKFKLHHQYSGFGDIRWFVRSAAKALLNCGIKPRLRGNLQHVLEIIFDEIRIMTNQADWDKKSVRTSIEKAKGMVEEMIDFPDGVPEPDGE